MGGFSCARSAGVFPQEQTMDDAALALEQEDADVERVAVDAPDRRARCRHGD